MRIAILSDVHANWQALSVVNNFLQTQGVDKIWFLGDIVGRGPDPIKTLCWLKDEVHNPDPDSWVLGNWDALINNMASADEKKQVNGSFLGLIEKHREIICEVPEVRFFVEENFLKIRLDPKIHLMDETEYILVHGGLVDHAGYYRYIYPWRADVFIPNELDILAAKKKETEFPLVLCMGHTHVPMLVSGVDQDDTWKPEVTRITPEQPYFLDPRRLWIINPGSVGQPRDRDNRAAFAILDTVNHQISFHRIEYPWRDTARELVRNGYDEALLLVLKEATPDDGTPPDWLDYLSKSSIDNV